MSLTADAKALIPAIRSLLNADEVTRQEIASLKGAQVGTIKTVSYTHLDVYKRQEPFSSLLMEDEVLHIFLL